LDQAARELAEHGVEEPRLEAELLLRHILGLDKAGLYSSLRERLVLQETSDFAALVQRRESREPGAYITGHREFFGLDLFVDRSVLIPRPETELLVEHVLHQASTTFADSCLIADIGTGCGAVAIAAAVNAPHARVYAVDISERALAVARANCERHRVLDRVTLLRGDLLNPVPEPVHVVVANLPYVREPEIDCLTPEVAVFEPRIALDGGVDGLREIGRLLEETQGHLLQGGAVLLEIGADQGPSVCAIARDLFPNGCIEVATDMGGLDRVVRIQT
jgi:release factor glutamine methyltransferase